MIKEATKEDLIRHDFVELAQEFFATSNLPGSFYPEVFIANWSKFLDLKIGVLLFYERDNKILGAIGGLIHPDVNDGQLVAQELFWFVKENSGLFAAVYLYKHFEFWARLQNAKRLNMACVCNKHMASLRKFYERQNFRAVDVSYFKDL